KRKWSRHLKGRSIEPLGCSMRRVYVGIRDEIWSLGRSSANVGVICRQDDGEGRASLERSAAGDRPAFGPSSVEVKRNLPRIREYKTMTVVETRKRSFRSDVSYILGDVRL